ncbi:uncharacterized protein DSM5745_11195 [Aspergillus mulundensis]|uniref:Uncharacterized protein n=1 Tax=Aspergillus mulundensis TaxID=1810919 RepID=A0A3D8QB49_9EURO|nr:hypothetical protein DSM5745_11195 [Aspergillus mulundensis]RDW58989.1 hypothetical protein DSM5745_11195 [Aspergillus mulundensis]
MQDDWGLGTSKFKLAADGATDALRHVGPLLLIAYRHVIGNASPSQVRPPTNNSIDSVTYDALFMETLHDTEPIERKVQLSPGFRDLTFREQPADDLKSPHNRINEMDASKRSRGSDAGPVGKHRERKRKR